MRVGMVTAHYCWRSYRNNALGQHDVCLTPSLCFRSLAVSTPESQRAYRAMLCPHLDATTIDNIRLARIEVMTDIRHEPRPRGRPHKESTDPQTSISAQQRKQEI